MILRIEERDWDPLVQQLLARRDVESAALLLCRSLPATNGPVMVVEQAVVVPDSAFTIRRDDQLQIDPAALVRLTHPAREHGWSVVTIHTHPLSDSPWFSQADDLGDDRLMRCFAVQMPDVPHGSVVVAGSGQALARSFDSEGTAHELPLAVVGRRLRVMPAPHWRGDEDRYARQKLALGAWGQSLLARAKVGVVGLGGTGSLAALQLLHLGVGELVLIDGDLVEASNLPRIVAACPADVGRTAKVAVLARYAETTGQPARVQQVPRHLQGEDELESLRDCDVVFSCVDRLTPRVLLNRLAYEALVPVLDLGTAFRVDPTGLLVSGAGRVVMLGPGRPCLACWGDLDPERLRVEALSADEQEEQAQAGYIEGADEHQPSVIAHNTMVAGAAVVEFLRLLTGFAGTEHPPLRLGFSFSDGTVRRNGLAGRADCRICGSRGDSPAP